MWYLSGSITAVYQQDSAGSVPVVGEGLVCAEDEYGGEYMRVLLVVGCRYCVPRFNLLAPCSCGERRHEHG